VKPGEPRSISIKIENRYYQFDPEVLTKALEDVALKAKQKKAPTGTLRATSGTRQSSEGPKARKKAQS
jgi:hypothetical protein